MNKYIVHDFCLLVQILVEASRYNYIRQSRFARIFKPVVFGFLLEVYTSIYIIMTRIFFIKCNTSKINVIYSFYADGVSLR